MSEVAQIVEVDESRMSLEDLNKDLLETLPTKEAGTPDTADKTEVKPETTQESTNESETITTKKKDDFVFEAEPWKAKGWNDEQIEVLRKSEEKNWNKEKFVQKQANELGETRKIAAELEIKQREAQLALQQAQVEKEQAKENLYEDPDAYAKAVLKEADATRQFNSIAFEQQTKINQQSVFSRVPEFQSLVENGSLIEVMEEECKKSGLDLSTTANVLNAIKTGQVFASNKDSIDILIQVAERAKDRTEIKELRSKVSSISASPDEVGRKIAQVANQRPVFNSVAHDSSDEREVDRMSLDELNKELGL